MTLQRGTPQMAAWLMSQWMPMDHPCIVTARVAREMTGEGLPVLGRLSETGIQCQFCGQEFERDGASLRHPR